MVYENQTQPTVVYEPSSLWFMKINKNIIQHIIYALVFLWFMGNPTQGHIFGPLGYMSHYLHKPLKGHVMSVTQVTPAISIAMLFALL